MARTFDNVAAGVEFSLRLFAFLRETGVKLGTLQTIACTRAIERLHACDTDALYRIYRTTLINRKEDFIPLQRVFAQLLEFYFNPGDQRESALNLRSSEQVVQVTQGAALSDTPADEDGDDAEAFGYSTAEVDQHKDFRFMVKEEFPAAMALLENIARRHAALVRRKARRANRGRVVDLRTSIRHSVKFDGDIFEWRYKRKPPTHTRLTVIVDVSGSMEVYSVFLLNFLHQLNQNRRLNIEVFVFSTDLQPLTQYFRLKNFRQMLTNVSAHFSGWSGGTKIGRAIATLNEEYAGSVSGKTLVTIMSDGWDTGDIHVLDREMARLASRAKAIVWINPLKADPGYEPLAVGMATAMPYIDEFIGGHNIDSLASFATLLNTQ